MRRGLVRALLLAPGLVAAAGPPAAGAGQGPQVRAIRIQAPPALDGRLDDPAWRAAPPACGFKQREPREAAPASEDTCVAVAFDAQHLYVAIRARDREPGAVIGRIRRRDRVIEADEEGYDWGDDDAVAVAVDTFHDGRNAFVFATNPEGAEFDALVSEESPILNHAWRTTWTVGAARGPDGWTAELAIPWRSLRYPSAGARFGFDVFRLLRRRHEESALGGWRRARGGLHRVSAFATLVGLEGLPRQPLNLEASAFAVLEAERAAAGGAGPGLGHRSQVGIDAKWEVRPGLVLDGTLRPDFSQVELDPLDLSLDPYPLFFAERRLFFLENAGVFTLGTHGHDEAPPFLLFFSRRIGYGGQRLLPVHGGLRLSGRAGPNVIGLLDVVADAEPPAGSDPAALPRPLANHAGNHAALRYKRELGGTGHAGLMLTDVRPVGCTPDEGCLAAAPQTALGLDAAVWAAPTLKLSGFYARTGLFSRPAGAFAGDTHQVSAEHDDGTTRLAGEVLGIGRRAEPALGFVARPGMRRFSVRGGRVLRTTALGLREIDLLAATSYTTSPGLDALDLQGAAEMSVRWASGPQAGLFAGTGFETVEEPWTLAGVVAAGAGRFAAHSHGLHAASNPAGPVVVSGYLLRRRAYGGRFDEVGLDLGARLGALATLEASSQAHRIHLGGQRLSYLSWAAAFEVAPSTRLTAGLVLQHRTLDHRFSGQARLVFTYHPASDLVLVLSEDRGDPETARHALALKVSLVGRL
jgi:hypothetical protein